MENKKILPAIVALLLAVSILSISTTATGTHNKPDVSISPNRVKAGVSQVFTLTVTNMGGNKIQRVQVASVVPTGFLPVDAAGELSEDTLVELAYDNYVVLPACTVLKPAENIGMWLKDNTIVIRENTKRILLVKTGEIGELRENAEIVISTGDDLGGTMAANGWGTNDNITPTDNLHLKYNKRVMLGDNVVILDNDTNVDKINLYGDNTAHLPENAWVRIVSENIGENFTIYDNLHLMKNKRVEMWDNMYDNYAHLAADVEVWNVSLGKTEIWSAGENIEFVDDNEVIILACTSIQPLENIALTIFENTLMIRENCSWIFYGTTQPKLVPEGWCWDSGMQYWWTDNQDVMIGSTKSKGFMFVATTPWAADNYLFNIMTTDNGDSPENRFASCSVLVDNMRPLITDISVSPDPAKGNTTVTITAETSEPLEALDNVMVEENNGENVQVTMTKTGENEWTGTYITDNENTERDGAAKVHILSKGVKDLVGYTQPSPDNLITFIVDRVPPPIPSATYNVTLPSGITRLPQFLLSGRTADNTAYKGIIDPVKGMKVKIRVGVATTNYEVTSGTGGLWSQIIEFEQGPNEVGVRYVDRAGNEGPENVDNIFVDNVPPKVEMTELSGKTFKNNMHIKDNTPTMLLTITDPGYPDTGLGVENDRFMARLLLDNGDLIAVLVNDLPWENSWQFENTWPTALDDGWYKVNAYASDNLNEDNENFRFKIDTLPPNPPSVAPAANPIYGGTAANPVLVKGMSIRVDGTVDESGLTVNAYINDTLVTSTTAASPWTLEIQLVAGLNKVELSAEDNAGNESVKVLLGYCMTDITAPTVSITQPTTGTKTDSATILVSGSVDDAVTDVEDLIVTLDAPSLSTPKTLTVGADGKFSTSISLTEGSNSITVYAIDEAGNTGSASVTVDRTVTAWGTYAIILVIVALILAAIAIFRKR